MCAHTAITEVPVTVTVLRSNVSNSVGFQIEVDDDLCDDLCESAAKVMHEKDMDAGHPVVWMCVDVEPTRIEMQVSRLKSITRVDMYNGMQLRCRVTFSIRCVVSDDDPDIALDRVTPLEVVSVL